MRVNNTNPVDEGRCECGGELLADRGNWVCKDCGLVHGREIGEPTYILARASDKDFEQFRQAIQAPTWFGCGSTFRVEPVKGVMLSLRWFHLAIVDNQTHWNQKRVEVLCRIRKISLGVRAAAILPDIVIEHAESMFKQRIEHREPVVNYVTYFAACVVVGARELHVPVTTGEICAIFRARGHRVNPRLVIQTCLREGMSIRALEPGEWVARYISHLVKAPRFVEKARGRHFKTSKVAQRIERVARRIVAACKGGRRPSNMAAAAVYGAMVLLHRAIGYPKVSQREMGVAVGIAEYTIRDVFCGEIKQIIEGGISID